MLEDLILHTAPYLREDLPFAKNILRAIDLKDLNSHNAWRVEEGLPPLTIFEVYEKVLACLARD